MMKFASKKYVIENYFDRLHCLQLSMSHIKCIKIPSRLSNLFDKSMRMYDELHLLQTKCKCFTASQFIDESVEAYSSF